MRKGYATYYRAWQRLQLEITLLRTQLQEQFRDTHRDLDDALALWLEDTYPGHENFEWQPLDENTVACSLHFPSDGGWFIRNVTVSVDELLPPTV